MVFVLTDCNAHVILCQFNGRKFLIERNSKTKNISGSKTRDYLTRYHFQNTQQFFFCHRQQRNNNRWHK